MLIHRVDETPEAIVLVCRVFEGCVCAGEEILLVANLRLDREVELGRDVGDVRQGTTSCRAGSPLHDEVAHAPHLFSSRLGCWS